MLTAAPSRYSQNLGLGPKKAGLGDTIDVSLGRRQSPQALSLQAAHGLFSPGMSLAHIQIKCQLESSGRLLFPGRQQQW